MKKQEARELIFSNHKLFREVWLTDNEYLVLKTIHKNEPITNMALATMLGKSKESIQSSILRLTSKGYIEREAKLDLDNIKKSFYLYSTTLGKEQ